MEYFRDEKGRLVTQKQYERALNRLSPIQRFINRIRYEYNMYYAGVKICKVIRKGISVCFLEYQHAKVNEIKDVIARLNYLGYDIDDINISYGTDPSVKFRVLLNNNEKGIDYVSC